MRNCRRTNVYIEQRELGEGYGITLYTSLAAPQICKPGGRGFGASYWVVLESAFIVNTQINERQLNLALSQYTLQT